MNEEMIQKVFSFAADLMTAGVDGPGIEQRLVGRLQLTPESAAQVVTTLFQLCKMPPDHVELCLQALRDKHGLEIGGPSAIFRQNSLLPVYPVMAGVDNCVFNQSTVWSGQLQEGRHYVYQENKPPGHQYIGEATGLRMIPDARYDGVLSCHNIEHVANPIQALTEWLRVLKTGGVLLLVAPHKEGTFDHQRPVTSLEHLIEDFNRGVGEDDLAHLAEILALHDLARDPAAGDRAQFKQRCADNVNNRCLHHHVFVTETVLALMNHVQLKIMLCDMVVPHYIIVLCQKPAANTAPDNCHFLGAGAVFRQRSPFQSDRVLNRH